MLALTRAGLRVAIALAMGLGLGAATVPACSVQSIFTCADDAACAAEAEMDGYYNTAFGAGGFPDSCKDEEGHHTVPGSWISMPPPLEDDQVEYVAVEGEDDGHGGHGGHGTYTPPPATVDQMSKDVSAFLMWAAEPKMVDRKIAGVRNIIALIILAVLFYYTNAKIWAPAKRKD